MGFLCTYMFNNTLGRYNTGYFRMFAGFVYCGYIGVNHQILEWDWARKPFRICCHCRNSLKLEYIILNNWQGVMEFIYISFVNRKIISGSCLKNFISNDLRRRPQLPITGPDPNLSNPRSRLHIVPVIVLYLYLYVIRSISTFTCKMYRGFRLFHATGRSA